jgi:hypothetical protein
MDTYKPSLTSKAPDMAKKNAGAVIPVSQITSFTNFEAKATFVQSGNDITVTISQTFKIASSKVFNIQFEPVAEFPGDPNGDNLIYFEFTNAGSGEIDKTKFELLSMDCDHPAGQPVVLKPQLKVLSGKTRWGIPS